MKMKFEAAIIWTCLTVFALSEPAPEVTPEKEPVEKHREGSEKIADIQDELSADVQQLVIEQTVPQVIELLNEVEKIMDETTDRLAESLTDGETMAAQTEIIEKIHAAAKERQKQQGSGAAGEAMMDMMEKMMGKEGEGKKPGGEKGDKPGDQGGKGMTGLSDEANNAADQAGEGKTEVRRIPKASGGSGAILPEEFRKAMDAYNRGAEQKAK